MWQLRNMVGGRLSERVVKGVDGCGGLDYGGERGLCVLSTEGDAGTYPSRQRCCAASAPHSDEMKGEASPPNPSPLPPLHYSLMIFS